MTRSARSVVALVPARGGSKGLPRKNLRALGGRPLLAYSVEAGLHCALVQRCLVSTEDAEIADTARHCGAEVIDRPHLLASDAARSREVALHALEWLEDRRSLPDYLVLLQPTSPLRHAGHVRACLETLFSSNGASAISVVEAEHHPFKAMRLVDGRLEPLISASYLEAPRQELPPAYRQNGAIYAVNVQAFRQGDGFWLPPAIPYVMTADESVDIDAEADLLRAEALLGARGVVAAR